MALTDNLVAAWECDEGANVDRVDSHNSYDMTDTGGNIGVATGKVYANAVSLDNSIFTVLRRTYNAALDPGDTDFTIEGWLNFDAESVNSRYSVFGAYGVNGGFTDYLSPYQLYTVDNDGIKLKFNINESYFGTAGAGYTISATISADTWTHFIAYHDATNNEIGLIINNGTPVTTSTGGTAPFSGNTNDYVSIGWLGNGAGDTFDGILGPIRFWNRLLTSDEKTSLYNSGDGLAYADFTPAGITFFGVATSPADDASNTSNQVTITPPSSMTEGDLVVVYMTKIASDMDLVGANSIGVTGGQTWTALSDKTETLTGAEIHKGGYWCRFNGTWGANPRFDFDGGQQFSAQMLVFRPSATTKQWAIDTAESDASGDAPGSPYTVTITGRTPAHDNNVSIAMWMSSDDNTYGSLSGTNWITTGLGSQYRNNGTTYDMATSYAYQIQTTAAATNNVSQNQATLGGDDYITSIITFYENNGSRRVFFIS